MNFNDWVKLHENEPSTPVTDGNEQAARPTGVPLDEMQIKNILKMRLEALFKELENQNFSRDKSLELLTIILKEFSQEFNLTSVQQKQAVDNIQ